MFSFRTTPLGEQLDKSLTQGLVVCFCTPNCYGVEQGAYTWELFARRGRLKKLLTPAEGEFVADSQREYLFRPDDFVGADAVVVDIQDVGTRGFALSGSVFALMRQIDAMGQEAPSLYVVDHLNPAGRGVEGSIPSGSKGGAWPKIPHRHGFTLGELCQLYRHEAGLRSPLHIISALAQGGAQLLPWTIPPARDIPGLFTCDVYSGASLWRQTNVTPGLGTPRPYEYFGAPFIDNSVSEPIPVPDGVLLRPCTFVPADGLYAGELCRGYQLLLLPGYEYHALGHTLQLMRYFRARYPQFSFGEKFSETLNDCVLEDFVRGGSDWPSVRDYLRTEEQKWIRKARKFTLYENYPSRIK